MCALTDRGGQRSKHSYPQVKTHMLFPSKKSYNNPAVTQCARRASLSASVICSPRKNRSPVPPPRLQGLRARAFLLGLPLLVFVYVLSVCADFGAFMDGILVFPGMAPLLRRQWVANGRPLRTLRKLAFVPSSDAFSDWPGRGQVLTRRVLGLPACGNRCQSPSFPRPQ